MSESIELKTDEKIQPVWQSTLKIIIGFGSIVMIGVSFYMWITGNKDWITYAIITGLLFAFVAVVHSEEERKRMAKFNEHLDVPVENVEPSSNTDTYEVSYLGGHPSHVLGSTITGIISLSETKLGFVRKYFEFANFEIDLVDISEISEETKESLTLGRFIMVGVLAFAFKKKENYLRITFRNGIGEMSTIIFETPKANNISQVITKKRYDYIVSKKQELGRNDGVE